MTRFEVQMLFTYGWDNCWMVHHQDGTSEPETFDSFLQAWETVLEFITDINDEIACGRRGIDEGYSIEEFRVVPVGYGGCV